MKIFLLACLAAFLFSCNSSDKSKKQDAAIQNKDSALHNPGTQPDQASVDIKPVQITAAKLPSTLKFKGKVQEAWQWKDKLGDNILITSFVEPYDDKNKNEYGEEAKTAELYAFHYVKKDGDYTLLWKISDAVKACDFDITCEFMKGGTTVTDLDKNGVAETKIQYAVACRSDVSPSYMKLIMHEDTVKYTLRGNMWLSYSPEFKYEVTEQNVDLEKSPKLKNEMEELLRTFGRYETEKEFAGAPAAFLPYARNEWLKYSKEKIGE